MAGRRFCPPRRGGEPSGAVVTLMAERYAEHYHGAIAVDAALQMRESNNPESFNLQPQIPLIFLVNQSEIAAARGP